MYGEDEVSPMHSEQLRSPVVNDDDGDLDDEFIDMSSPLSPLSPVSHVVDDDDDFDDEKDLYWWQRPCSCSGGLL